MLWCLSPRHFSILRNKHLNKFELFRATVCSGFFRCALFFHPEILWVLSRIQTTTLSRHFMGLLASETWLTLGKLKDRLWHPLYLSFNLFFFTLLYAELLSSFTLCNWYILWSNAYVSENASFILIRSENIPFNQAYKWLPWS